MDSPVTEIVIVGGGTAGWIAANRIAAAADGSHSRPLGVTLIESPDIPTVGVGEGTWPTMRRTLAEIGLDESDFLISCDASFKQGSRFDGWVDGSGEDSYLHPFTPPPGVNARSNIAAWQSGELVPFAQAMTPQHAVCNHDLAPRQRSMPPFSGAVNYAYHLDAGKFARRLAEHATATLGVRHVRDRVTSVERDDNGFIRCVGTLKSGEVAADLFLDCSVFTDSSIITIADASSGSKNPAERPIARQLPLQMERRWPLSKRSFRIAGSPSPAPGWAAR